MIRVNLLPRRREAKRESGRAWIAVLVVLGLAMVVGIIIVDAQKGKALSEQIDKNTQLEQSIAKTKSDVGGHDAVKKQLAEMQTREDAISKLVAGRTGPTGMMLELSRILTGGKMPTYDQASFDKLKANTKALPNVGWDTHRVWIASFKEADRNVTITGFGKTNDDVAEFLRRMTISVYFSEVKLVKTEEKPMKPTGPDNAAAAMLTAISFELRAKVRY